MRQHLSSLWSDEAGFIVSAELVLLGTLLVVGLIAGLSCVQEAVIGEYQDVAGAIRSLDQSYAFNGMHGCINPQCGVGSWTAGSAYPPSNAVFPACFDCCFPQVGECLTCPPDVPVTPAIPEAPADVAPPCCVEPVTAPIICEAQVRLQCAPPAACRTLPPTTGIVSCWPTLPEPVVRACECESSVPTVPVCLSHSGACFEPLPLAGPLVW